MRWLEQIIDERWRQHSRPLATRGQETSSFLEGHLQRLAASREPSAADQAAREKLIQRLSSELNAVFPNSALKLQPYGSYLSSCYSSSSDLDLALSGAVHWELLQYEDDLEAAKMQQLAQADGLLSLDDVDPRLWKGLLVRLADDLEERGLSHGPVERVLEARVPIIKFTDPRTGIECDVCVTTRGCDFKAQVMRLLQELAPTLGPMIQLVKLWAKAHDMNSAQFGTLNSWSLALMALFALQTMPPKPLLPPLWRLFHEAEPAGSGKGRPLQEKGLPTDLMLEVARLRCSEETLVEPDVITDPPSLLEQLAWFLSSFATITSQWKENMHYRSWRVSTWLGRGYMRSYTQNYLAAMEEPFDVYDNTARSVGSKMFNPGTLSYISWVFGHSAQLLSSVSTPQDAALCLAWLFGPEVVPQLGPQLGPSVRSLSAQELGALGLGGHRLEADEHHHARSKAMRALVNATRAGSPILCLDEWYVSQYRGQMRPPFGWHHFNAPSEAEAQAAVEAIGGRDRDTGRSLPAPGTQAAAVGKAAKAAAGAAAAAQAQAQDDAWAAQQAATQRSASAAAAAGAAPSTQHPRGTAAAAAAAAAQAAAQASEMSQRREAQQRAQAWMQAQAQQRQQEQQQQQLQQQQQQQAAAGSGYGSLPTQQQQNAMLAQLLLGRGSLDSGFPSHQYQQQLHESYQAYGGYGQQPSGWPTTSSAAPVPVQPQPLATSGTSSMLAGSWPGQHAQQQPALSAYRPPLTIPPGHGPPQQQAQQQGGFQGVGNGLFGLQGVSAQAQSSASASAQAQGYDQGATEPDTGRALLNILLQRAQASNERLSAAAGDAGGGYYGQVQQQLQQQPAASTSASHQQPAHDSSVLSYLPAFAGLPQLAQHGKQQQASGSTPSAGALYGARAPTAAASPFSAFVASTGSSGAADGSSSSQQQHGMSLLYGHQQQQQQASIAGAYGSGAAAPSAVQLQPQGSGLSQDAVSNIFGSVQSSSLGLSSSGFGTSSLSSALQGLALSGNSGGNSSISPMASDPVPTQKAQPFAGGFGPIGALGRYPGLGDYYGGGVDGKLSGKSPPGFGAGPFAKVNGSSPASHGGPAGPLAPAPGSAPAQQQQTNQGWQNPQGLSPATTPIQPASTRTAARAPPPGFETAAAASTDAGATGLASTMYGASGIPWSAAPQGSGAPSAQLSSAFGPGSGLGDGASGLQGLNPWDAAFGGAAAKPLAGGVASGGGSSGGGLAGFGAYNWQHPSGFVYGSGR